MEHDNFCYPQPLLTVDFLFGSISLYWYSSTNSKCKYQTRTLYMGFVQNKKELLKILSGIKDVKLMEDFLVDLLTPAEVKDIVLRWQIVKLLSQGITQREVAKKLGVSISKVERGARELLDKKGGFGKILIKQIKQ